MPDAFGQRFIRGELAPVAHTDSSTPAGEINRFGYLNPTMRKALRYTPDSFTALFNHAVVMDAEVAALRAEVEGFRKVLDPDTDDWMAVSKADYNVLRAELAEQQEARDMLDARCDELLAEVETLTEALNRAREQAERRDRERADLRAERDQAWDDKHEAREALYHALAEVERMRPVVEAILEARDRLLVFEDACNRDDNEAAARVWLSVDVYRNTSINEHGRTP